MPWLGTVILLVLHSHSSKSDSTMECPCVSGTWKYKGDSFSFCNNPNNAFKTEWCPTQTNSDGSYTSNLPFTYCEGEVRTACQTAKQSEQSCPCAPEWKFQGDTYSYCADPTSAGFEWCATELDEDGNYVTGKYAKCSTAVQDACLVAEDAAEDVPDTTGCPCLPGGQWTFNGERQSYCQKPNGIGKKAWCPTLESVVTSENMGTVSTAYCYTKKMRACQALEGSRLPTQCPCLDGGQFKYKGQSYSYCENSNWCATEVDDKGNFIGKFAKCRGKKVKAACHELHLLTTASGPEDKYGEFTQTNTGCPCWFDMTRDDCACCKSNGVGCGAPMQQWCTSREEGRQSGCLGVPANHWTLSTTGHPCYWNTSRTDCAWCATGGAQCGPEGNTGPDSAVGSRCSGPEEAETCDSVPGNCKHMAGICDSQAQCKFSVKFGDREHWQCVCNAPDWVGNGIQCYDKDGNPSPETVSSSSGDVRLTLAVTHDYYVYPHDSSEFPLGPGETNLLTNITDLFTAGASCAGDNSCNGTYISLQESP